MNFRGSIPLNIWITVGDRRYNKGFPKTSQIFRKKCIDFVSLYGYTYFRYGGEIIL